MSSAHRPTIHEYSSSSIARVMSGPLACSTERTFESGDTTINVYRSSFAGTNKATALTWTVDDVEDVVRTLKAKGVKFEHYDLPDTRREGDDGGM